MPVGIAIQGLFAVGMHHYGPRELRVGCGYRLKREPTNTFDKNAIAIQENGVTRAYLSRGCASRLSKVLDCVLPVGSIYLKPKFPAEIRSRRPQQYCNVGFRVREENVEDVQRLLTENNLTYRCLGRI